ncbi:MAG: nitroreductase family protein [Nitrososphaerales archaeon]
MDLLEAIKNRRSIRKYRKGPIPEVLILEILEAGRWAPSAGNSQPWNFILLKDEQVKKNVADATTNGGFLAEASNHPVED